MNQFKLGVYRIIKTMPLMLIFLLISVQLMAQNPNMPFELERYSSSVYNEELERLDTAFASETDPLTYYFTAYKVQRAENPQAYFISPNDQRIFAANYMKANFPGGQGMALVNFLENKGDIQSCNALLSQSDQNNILLPYQYVAALLLKQDDKADAYLNKMMTSGMISEVTIAYGKNAVNSFDDGDIVITQGLQDLIAIDYALMKSEKSATMKNRFIENILSYDGVTISSLLNQEAASVWVSPSVSSDFYAAHINNLWSAGIGMRYVHGPNPNPEKAMALLRFTGENFIGLNTKAVTPADIGLTHSYQEFAIKFENLSSIEKSQSLSRKARKIMKFAGL